GETNEPFFVDPHGPVHGAAFRADAILTEIGSSTSLFVRSSAMWAANATGGTSPKMRQYLPPEELDLLVAPISPELEHDVGAAGVAVLLDRGDAVGRSARDALAPRRGGDG